MTPSYSQVKLPVIDIGPLVALSADSTDDDSKFSELVLQVSKEIGEACEEYGFFYIVGYGDYYDELADRLFAVGRNFFKEPVEYKDRFNMKNSKVYRGYFQLGDELTSYKKDWKEGYYFSSELSDDHPAVVAQKPMHGKNQWPDESDHPDFKPVILEYMDSLTNLGHIVMSAIAISLGLDKNFFRHQFTSEPFIPFRLFHYPADPVGLDEKGDERWGVGRHTDYGVLTLLRQDDCGGLEVEHRTSGEWIQAPYISNSFVVNIGDMLERWTCGKYKATPHRVKNTSGRDRLSAPFFFDPNFDTIVTPLEEFATSEEDRIRWPPIKYGDYILSKVFAVFPELKADAIK